MMRREYIREPSLAARWAVPASLFSCVLGFTATIAHRSGLLSTQNFVLVAALTFLFALFGFSLSLFGLYAVWTRAAKGGMRSARAFFLSLPVLLTGLLAITLVAVTAPLSDISTDTLDPPHFSMPSLSTNSANINEPPRINRQIQTQFYPHLIGRRYVLATDTIVAHVVRQINDKGWLPAYENAHSLGDGDWIIEATVKTPVFGFVDNIVVRITDEGDATYVDMRSAAHYGLYDLGGNARRIERFMRDLDVRVSQQAQ